MKFESPLNDLELEVDTENRSPFKAWNKYINSGLDESHDNQFRKAFDELLRMSQEEQNKIGGRIKKHKTKSKTAIEFDFSSFKPNPKAEIKNLQILDGLSSD